MTVNPNYSPIERYFAGLAENTFQSQLGVVDPPLIDYLTDMLIRFIRNDSMHRVRSITGHRLLDVAELMAEATQRIGDAKRDLMQHIGDFTLFWAGVYPEALRDRTTSSGDAKFESYCSYGKRSYRIASSLQPGHPDADLLERLSDRYDLCCYGLREVRRQWEDGGNDMYGSGTILLN